MLPSPLSISQSSELPRMPIRSGRRTVITDLPGPPLSPLGPRPAEGQTLVSWPLIPAATASTEDREFPIPVPQRAHSPRGTSVMTGNDDDEGPTSQHIEFAPPSRTLDVIGRRQPDAPRSRPFLYPRERDDQLRSQRDLIVQEWLDDLKDRRRAVRGQADQAGGAASITASDHTRHDLINSTIGHPETLAVMINEYGFNNNQYWHLETTHWTAELARQVGLMDQDPPSGLPISDSPRIQIMYIVLARAQTEMNRYPGDQGPIRLSQAVIHMIERAILQEGQRRSQRAAAHPRAGIQGAPPLSPVRRTVGGLHENRAGYRPPFFQLPQQSAFASLSVGDPFRRARARRL